MERKLTQKFMSYHVAQMEKAEGESIVSMIPKLLPYNPGLLIKLIQTGCPITKMNAEAAGEKLDMFLSSDGNDYETAVLAIVAEIDADTKVLRCVGLSVAEVQELMNSNRSQTAMVRELSRLEAIGIDKETIMEMLKRAVSNDDTKNTIPENEKELWEDTENPNQMKLDLPTEEIQLE